MILGVGTDIVSFTRIQAVHERFGKHFARRLLSDSEMIEYSRHTYPARMLLKRFAAKEALAKAAGHGLRYPLTLRRISVVHDAIGKPCFLFEAELADFLRKMGVVRHHLSISDERDYAVAYVVLETA